MGEVIMLPVQRPETDGEILALLREEWTEEDQAALVQEVVVEGWHLIAEHNRLATEQDELATEFAAEGLVDSADVAAEAALFHSHTASVIAQLIEALP